MNGSFRVTLPRGGQVGLYGTPLSIRKIAFLGEYRVLRVFLRLNDHK